MDDDRCESVLTVYSPVSGEVQCDRGRGHDDGHHYTIDSGPEEK